MVNKIYGLRHVLVKDKGSKAEPQKKSIFEYVILESDEFVTMNADGHCTLDEAFEIAKDRFTKTIMKYGLKEAIDVIDLSDDELKLFNINNKDEIYELVFDKNVLDENSKLYNNFRNVLLNHWGDQLEPIYYVCNHAKNTLIHDDLDKKTLKDHYFESLNEFNNHISFLEYFNNIVVPEMLIPNGFNTYMCNEYSCLSPDYYIIDDTITRSQLQDFLDNHNIKLNIGLFRQSVIWAGFGYYFGITHGLSDIESKGFASMLNKELCSFRSKDLKFGVEENFKGDLIEKIISHVAIGRYTLEDRTKIKFYSLFDLFKNRIRDFEYKNKRLEFRVSQRQYDKFMALDGKSKADKLDNLMNNGEIIEDSKLPDINFNEGGLNRWLKDQDEKLWDEIKANESSYSELSYQYITGETKEIIDVNYEEGYLSPNMKMINEELASMTPEQLEAELKFMEEIEAQEEMMKELENMTSKDWEAELRWMQQVEEEEESRKMAEEAAKEYLEMSPEQRQAEIEFMEQEQENEKMMQEIKEEYENMTPEQLQAEMEYMNQQEIDEDEIKKMAEEAAREHDKNKKLNEDD